MSTLNEYQEQAGKTNKGTVLYVYDDPGMEGGCAGPRRIDGMYNALGMNGEAGECAEKVKKAARDGVVDYAAYRTEVCKELGDVLWYLSQLARDFGFTLQDVADANLAKLRDRASRNVLGGSGDNR